MNTWRDKTYLLMGKEANAANKTLYTRRWYNDATIKYQLFSSTVYIGRRELAASEKN